MVLSRLQARAGHRQWPRLTLGCGAEFLISARANVPSRGKRFVNLTKRLMWAAQINSRSLAVFALAFFAWRRLCEVLGRVEAGCYAFCKPVCSVYAFASAKELALAISFVCKQPYQKTPDLPPPATQLIPSQFLFFSPLPPTPTAG